MKHAVLLWAFVLAACATMPAALAGPSAGFGQVAQTAGPNVRPISLIEDSRCPTDVQCVWAGRVRILVEIGHDRFRREMTLGGPVAIDNGHLTLVAVEPAKVAATGNDRPAYRFTFRFER